jgi:ubiquinone/menaquinone biosynthesis C-methylase UbiE
MSTPSKPEKPSTYFVQDRSHQEELQRLQALDHLLTTGMGGVLPEHRDPTIFHSVLDVGCGTGGWLIEIAKAIPDSTRLVGVDVSRTFVEYARVQAEEAGVSDRVEFRVMDALLMLEFRDQTFDLVNHRCASSWLRTWDWPKLLSEYRRVCRFGGIVRVTEPELAPKSDSAAQMYLTELFIRAFYLAGHLFTDESAGVINELAHVLHQHGLQEVQTRSTVLEYYAGTSEGHYFFENIRLIYRNVVPFLRKWTKVPENYDQMYQQAITDIQQPDSVGTWGLLTAWGKV